MLSRIQVACLLPALMPLAGDCYALPLEGDLIGLCGNSGNSSEPHMHMQDGEDMGAATGIYVPFSQIHINGDRVKSKIPEKGNYVSNQGATRVH